MRSLVAFAVLACSCDGFDFTGIWRGPSSSSFACANGQTGSGESPLEWAIVQTGRELTVTPDGGSCGAIVADLEGASAEFRPMACSGRTAVEGGRLTPETSRTIRVSLKATFPFDRTSCTESTTALLELAK